MPRAKPVIERLDKYTDKSGECWEWIGCKNKKGYGVLHLSGRPQLAHRLSYKESVGEIPDGLFVLHRCDNPACVNPAHLWLGDNSENVADMISKGRNARGHVNGHAKFSESDVLEIRSDIRSSSVIAKERGVTQSCIWRIRSGARWSHVALPQVA